MLPTRPTKTETILLWHFEPQRQNVILTETESARLGMLPLTTSFLGSYQLFPGRVATVQVRSILDGFARFAAIAHQFLPSCTRILGRVFLAHARRNQQQELQLKETDHISTLDQFLSRHRCGTCPEIELPRLTVYSQK